MPMDTRSKTGKLPPKRNAEDEEDADPESKAPRRAISAQAPDDQLEPTTQVQTCITRSRTGKLPAKRKAEDDVSPKARAARKASPAREPKPANKAQPYSKVQSRSTTKDTSRHTARTSTRNTPAQVTENPSSLEAQAATKRDSGIKAKPSQGKPALGPATETTTKDSITVKPALSKPRKSESAPGTSSRAKVSGKGKVTGKAKTTAKFKQSTRSGNPAQQHSGPGAPRASQRGIRSQMSESPSEDNEEIKRSKAKSNWREPKVVNDMQLPPKPAKIKPLTQRSDTDLIILVSGEGDHGELGLGIYKHDGQLPTRVIRPRLNYHLSWEYLGVVDVACGSRHSIALTRDGQILTWGWNEDGALGRETNFDPKDMGEPDENGWKPGPVDFSHLQDDITWTQVVATDSGCFALANDGSVFGWGTFLRKGQVLGFDRAVAIQHRPARVEGLSNITNLAAGSQHVLAIDYKCRIYAWGCGDQGQLGHHFPSRDVKSCLRPRSVAPLPDSKAKAQHVACGARTSFALDQRGHLYAWGHNNDGQLGVPQGFQSGAPFVMIPQRVKALDGHKVEDIAGGRHHSLACTSKGHLFTWGRNDHSALGLPRSSLSERTSVLGEDDEPLWVAQPTRVKCLKNIVSVAAGKLHSIAVDDDGVVYTFGRSREWQTGQGTQKHIKLPAAVHNDAIDDTFVHFADGGHGYSVFAGVQRECGLANGV